jgi:hypothetical protein
MTGTTQDTELIAAAIAYVTELHQEMTVENGAAAHGTQNQAVDFILGDPELREAAVRWAARFATGEATTAPARRLPQDALYRRVRAVLEEAEAPAPFAPP